MKPTYTLMTKVTALLQMLNVLVAAAPMPEGHTLVRRAAYDPIVKCKKDNHFMLTFHESVSREKFSALVLERIASERLLPCIHS